MHILLGNKLDGEGYKADPFIIKENLYPVNTRYLEGRVKTNGNIAVPLGLIEKVDAGLGLREHLLAVRSQKPDPRSEFTLPASPLIHNREAVMQGRERIRVDALKKSHQAQFAAHLLTYIITQDRVAQMRFDLYIRHNVTLTHTLKPRQSVFS